jgi:hypothetical protein
MKARRKEQGWRERHVVAEARVEAEARAVRVGEGLEAGGQVGVEPLDVPSVELHRVHVVEREVRTPPRQHLLGGVGQGGEVVEEVAAFEHDVDGEVGPLRDRLELLEQRLEDRFLVLEVVVDRAGRDSRLAGDVAHARRPVAAMREQLEGGVEDGGAAALGTFDLKHGRDC